MRVNSKSGVVRLQISYFYWFTNKQPLMHFVQHPYVLLKPVEVIKGPARSPFVTARPASHLAIAGRIGQRATQTRRKVNILSLFFCFSDL